MLLASNISPSWPLTERASHRSSAKNKHVFQLHCTYIYFLEEVKFTECRKYIGLEVIGIMPDYQDRDLGHF